MPVGVGITRTARLGAMAALLAALPPFALADGEPCPASAIITGDQQLAGQARADLARRGVVSVPPAGCRQVRAHIRREGEHLVVSVEDGYGRRSQREVRDLATATALVESWTRQEVVVAMLPPEPAAKPEPATEVVVVAAAPAAAALGAGVGLAIETSRATDGSSWLGASAAGCGRLGPICAGGVLRGAADTGWSTDSTHSRREADLLATAEWPLGGGGFSLTPGIAIGLGWLQAQELGPHHDQTQDTGGLRAGATLALGRALGAGFAIGLVLSVDRFVAGGDASATDGTAIAPTGQLRAGLGLRYGGR